MTDSQLLSGIMQNDERAWRFICRTMKSGFVSIIGQRFPFGNFSKEDMEDLFQTSCIVLMQKVKEGAVSVSREGALFSYLVQVGKLTANNLIRKRSSLSIEDMVTIPDNPHKEDEDYDISVDEKQQAQDEFIDRVFEKLSPECKTLFKHYYWGHKTLDEIASILGMRNADSAKSKKFKCMKKAKDIGNMLIKCGEFTEDEIRAAVERISLKELIKEETFYAENGISMAALDVDEDTE
ncbi:MAG: sigma-70 family RNA polymerase sigma factor [Muribaculaceae bacterium]|nr:sigma-70 family RNA polymerase sigma factor [Muribaculaceae bacterium]MEE1297306.1 sigma-70 family RNA polymerase sigma factor [Muribaculaceae bacterium]